MPFIDEKGDVVFSGPATHLVPVNVRAFVTTLLGRKDPITEKDFTPDDLNALKRAVTRNAAETGARSGAINYDDYYSTRPAKWSPDAEKMFDFEQGRMGALAIVKNSVADTGFRLNTTLGNAAYKIQDDGTAVVEDKYDFMHTQATVDDILRRKSTVGALSEAYTRYGVGGLLNMVGNIFGRAEGNGVPVRINLGAVE